MERLGLTEDELCATLDCDPLTILSGQAEQLPQLRILLDLLADAHELVGDPALRRWVRATGRLGRPVDALTRRDFERFEDALRDLGERGLVLRRSGEE